MADAQVDTALADQVYFLRRALIKHRRLQTYSLSMLRECVIMAAFQVVDVRLSLLENKGKEEVTIGDLIWEAAVVACFGFAGSLVEKGLTAVFNSILKTRLAYSLVPKTELGGWVKAQQDRDWEKYVGDYKKQLETRYKIARSRAEPSVMWDEYKVQLAKEDADLKLFVKGFLDQNDVRLLYHEFTFKAVDPLIKSASNLESIKTSLGKLRVDESATQTGANVTGNAKDLPTVRVLRSALEFFDRQIETQHLVLDEFDLALSCGRYNTEELERLSLILIPGADASFESITMNLDVWVRFFEFCIWVTLYPAIGTTRPRILVPGIGDTPDALLDYLIRRIFVDYKSVAVGNRPFTILENAIFTTMQKREVQRDFNVQRGRPESDRDLNKAVSAAKPAALNDLVEAWREMSDDMARGTERLYARALG